MSNMVVNTNVLALNSHRALKNVGNLQTKSSARLSSGMKINSAADDAAGLAISEKMRAQIRGLDMASKNSQDAISLIQTAEGGMQEIDNMIQRMRELVNQAANDTNETEDRSKIQDEVNELVKEIDSMSGRVEFNKKKVINGNFEAAKLKVDDTKKGAAITAAEVTELVDVFKDLHAAKNKVTASNPTKVEDLEHAQKVRKAYENLDSVVGNKTIEEIFSDVDLTSSFLKKGQELFNAITAATGSLSHNGLGGAGDSAALGKLKDLVEPTNGKLDILDAYNTTQAAVYKADAKTASEEAALHFQVGANAKQSMTLNIGSMNTLELGIGDGNGESRIDVTKSGAEISKLLNTMDEALSHVTTERSKLGAAQNRLEYTIKSLDVSSENLSAAESRIRDTDMAKEMMNSTKASVLQQAATSMLAQANQAPQGVLKLLQ